MIPKTAGVPVLMAVALLAAGCVSTTTGDVQSEVSDEDAASRYYELGVRYYRNGKYGLARDRLERALELDPRHAKAHSTLALTYVELDNLRLANEHSERSVRYAPNDVDVRNAHAVFLCQQRRYDDAREHFERSLRVPENDDPEIMLTNAGVCMLQKPDPELAEEYFRKALDRKPGYGEALMQLAFLKHDQEDDLGARAFLQRFLSRNPATPEVLYLLMQVERDVGDDRASAEYAMRLLREFPDSSEAERVRQGT